MTASGCKWIEQATDIFWPASLELLFAATLVLVMAMAFNLGLCRAAASVRHRVWALAMGGLLLLPLLCALVPKVPIRLSIPITAARPVLLAPERIDDSAAAAPRQEELSLEVVASSTAHRLDEIPVRPSSAPSPQVRTRSWNARSLFVWSCWVLMVLWTLGSGLCLAAMARSFRFGQRLAKGVLPLDDPSWQALLDEIGDRLGVRRAVVVGVSQQCDIPLAIGWYRPKLLLPADCIRWTAAKRRVVLIHELSHAVRRDVLWQVVARLACAVYWFHPLVWLADRRLRVERELACDDAVLRFGGQPDQYATMLLDVAAALRQRPATCATVVAMACRNSVERRIRAILQPGLSRLPVGPRTGTLTLFGAIVLVVLTAALHPFAPPQVMSASTASVPWVSLQGLAVGWTPRPIAEADSPQRSDKDLYGDALPPGAVARLGTLAFRQQDSTRTVVFLADGKTILVVTPDAGLRYYEAATGMLLRSFSFGEHGIIDGAMTPNGELLAVVGGRFDEAKATRAYYMSVFEPATGKQKTSVETSERLGEKLAISPDGATVVVAGRGGKGKLRFWDVASGTEVLTYDLTGRGDFHALALSPDSKTLAISADNKLWLWDWASQADPRKVRRQDTGRMQRAISLDFAPDGKTLAVGTDGGGAVLSGEVILVDVAAGTVVADLSSGPSRRSYVRDVAFSPDGSRLAATRDPYHGGGVVIWNPADKQHVCTLPVHHNGVTDLTFSPDGQTLAAVDSWSGSSVQVWDLRTNREVLGERPAHDAGPSCIAFLDDGQTVATASDDGTMRFWETRSGRHTAVLTHPKSEEGRTGYIRAFAASPDGALVASSSLDDTVRLWDVATGKQVYQLPGHGRLGGHRELAFSADGKRLVSWGDDMRVFVWDVATGKALQEYRVQPSGANDLPEDDDMPREGTSRSFRIHASSFSHDGTRLVLNLGKFFVFDVETGKQLCDFEAESTFSPRLAVSRDNEYVLTSQFGRDVQTKLPDGRTRYTAARNHLVILRRVRDGSVVKQIVLPERGAGPVAFSPDGKHFAAAASRDEDSLIRLFLTSTGEEVGQIAGLDSHPISLAFSPDSRLLVSGMRNTTVLVWDLASVLRSAP